MDNHDLVGLLQSDPRKLTDHELLFLDYSIHHAWQSKCDGGSGVHFKPCTLDHLVELHSMIRRQMEMRGFRHLIADQLDARTSLLEQQRRTIEVGFYRGALGGRLPGSGDIDAGERDA